MEGQILEGKRILVVENEREILNMVSEALAASEVVAVGNVEDARPLIARESFDLAILDTVHSNGCALLEDCHANKLPTAMLTPREVEVGRVNEAMKRGVMSFFPKDDLDRLPETVSDLLAHLGKGTSTRLSRRIWAAFREIWPIVREEADRDRSSNLPRVYW
jgi:DNA-binding NtrC family response regulator